MKKINNPKTNATIALKKARSNITKIIAMIEKDVYCIDILNQLLATNGLIRSASEKILTNHLNTCFKENIHTNDMMLKTKLVEEVISVINLSGRAR